MRGLEDSNQLKPLPGWDEERNIIYYVVESFKFFAILSWYVLSAIPFLLIAFAHVFFETKVKGALGLPSPYRQPR